MVPVCLFIQLHVFSFVVCMHTVPAQELRIAAMCACASVFVQNERMKPNSYLCVRAFVACIHSQSDTYSFHSFLILCSFSYSYTFLFLLLLLFLLFKPSHSHR